MISVTCLIPVSRNVGTWKCILTDSMIILCMRPANERRRYSVTSSRIGWAHTQNDHCRLIVWFIYQDRGYPKKATLTKLWPLNVFYVSKNSSVRKNLKTVLLQIPSVVLCDVYRWYPAKRASPWLRMADRALLAGYHRYVITLWRILLCIYMIYYIYIYILDLSNSTYKCVVSLWSISVSQYLYQYLSWRHHMSVKSSPIIRLHVEHLVGADNKTPKALHY